MSRSKNTSAKKKNTPAYQGQNPNMNDYANRKFYIILGVIFAFLLFFVTTSTIKMLHSIKSDECFINMALFGEAQMALQKEYGFKFISEKTKPEEIMYTIFAFSEYGDKAFKDAANKNFNLLTKDELKNIPKPDKIRFFRTYKECPHKGKYEFIPSKKQPGLFDIKCSYHGTLFLPDPKTPKKYTFDGDKSFLKGRQTEFGWTGSFEFPKDLNVPNGEIIISDPDYIEKGTNSENSETNKEDGKTSDSK